MNKASFLCICAISSSPFLHSESQQLSSEMTHEIEQYSRHEGYQIAKALQASTEWISLPYVIEGMQEFLNGKHADTDCIPGNKGTILFHLFLETAHLNLQKAEAFLQEEAQKPGIVSLKNGCILYKILCPGTGDPVVKQESAPLLHYVISSLNGEKIYDTKEANKPTKIVLSEAILGFCESVTGMRIGERRIIFIHPDCAYGKVGLLPPNSLVIADVEVISL